MLLRRVTEHVNQQNWFAVGIDFFIVILGVYIGIQVANWNDENKDFAKDQALLLRLQADFERIVEFGERLEPLVAEQPESTRRLIAALGEDAKFTLADGAQMLTSAVLVWASYEDSPAYREIVEAGTLSRIANPKLRDALSLYARGLTADKGVGVHQSEIRMQGVIDRAVQFDYPATGEIVVVKSFDWDLLKETVPHLQVVLQMQRLRAMWYSRMLDTAKDVLRLVNAELGTQ